tara:strand:- start:747 stop:944 length:198 start_codon:yes stop_codon:yes gene_type:complete
MSKVDEALDNIKKELEFMGYSKDKAIELVKKDIDEANRIIEEYYEEIEMMIDNHINSMVDIRKGG